MSKIPFNPTRAKSDYRTPDGLKVPPVTTVLGMLAKPALIHWAWKLGMEGTDYRKAKDEAADIGKLAHFMVECHLQGNEPDLSMFSEDKQRIATQACMKFLGWWNERGYTVIANEVPLVCSKLGFGGTLDILARTPDDRIHLVDLKTSKAIYDENWLQLAAYRHLAIEAGFKVKKCIVCRMGKEDLASDFEVQERSLDGDEFAAFAALLAAYNALQAIGYGKR